MGGLGITAPILLALLYLDVFALSEHPGQWIYLRSNIAVRAIGIPTAVLYRRAQRLAPRTASVPGGHVGIPAPRTGVGDDVVRERWRLRGR